MTTQIHPDATYIILSPLFVTNTLVDNSALAKQIAAGHDQLVAQVESFGAAVAEVVYITGLTQVQFVELLQRDPNGTMAPPVARDSTDGARAEWMASQPPRPVVARSERDTDDEMGG